MTALRCTAKLLKVLRGELVANPSPPRNRLGEWTANLFRFGRTAYVVAVNEHTRLGLVVKATPYATLPTRFSEQLCESLIALGIEHDQAADEAKASQPTSFAPSNSSSVLATLTRYYFDLEAFIHYDGPQPASVLSARLLDEIILSPKHIGRPADRVREVFGLPRRPARFWRKAANDG